MSCNTKQDLQDLYSSIGLSDPITALCTSGFRREGFQGGKPQPIEDCVNTKYNGDDARFRPIDDDRGKTQKEFIARMNAYYFGDVGNAGGGNYSSPKITGEERYWYAWKSMQVLCGAIEGNQDASDEAVRGNNKLVRVPNPDGKSVVLEFDRPQNDKVNTGPYEGIDGRTDYSCANLANLAITNSDSYQIWAKLNPEGPTGDGTVGGTGGTGVTNGEGVEVKCTDDFSTGDQFNPLNWIMCPLINGAAGAAKGIETFITGMLCIDEKSIFGTGAITCGDGSGNDNSAAFYAAWNVFRVLALAMIAVGGLLMVISQAIGFEIFDAYTVKKVLPRILIAGILISLSWPLLQFFVALSNALGVGIRGIIYAPFNDANIDTVVLGGGPKALGSLFALGGLAFLGIFGILSFVLTGLLALGVAFFVLVIRNILVIFLIIAAPLAIAMYVVPNTEKYFKTWWDWLIKALLAFPIITAMIAIGHVFAAITAKNGGNFSSIVAFVAYFAPYFLIPAAFRFAGGALATIGGLANDRSRGAFDRLSKFRQGQSAKNAQKIKNFDRVSERSALGRGVNSALGAIANPTSAIGGPKSLSARRAASQKVIGENFWKENTVAQAYEQDDNFTLAVASKELAMTKLNSAKAKRDQAVQARSAALTAPGGGMGSEAYMEANKSVLSAQADIDARQRGIDAANQLPLLQRGNRSVRMTALDRLTKSGYQFSDGEAGYNEVSNVVDDIYGNDAGARAQAMDGLQYNLRAAGGRFELGGINHGAFYDYDAGNDKGNAYGRGQGKVQTYTAGAESKLGRGAMKLDASGKATGTLEEADLTRYLTQSISDGSLDQAQAGEWHRKLTADEHGATGGNEKEIRKQKAALEEALRQSASMQLTPEATAGRDQLARTITENQRRVQPSQDDHLNNTAT